MPGNLSAAENYYQEGLAFEKARQFTQAYQSYTEATALNHVKAQTNLGTLWLKGRGVTVDKTEACRCLLSSAKAGHVRAMANVALMLRRGDGIPKNLAEALYWYEQAAHLGDTLAYQESLKIRKAFPHLAIQAPMGQQDSFQAVLKDLNACSVRLQDNDLKSQLEFAEIQLKMFEQYGLIPEDRAFQSFLTRVKALIEEETPRCFISYAWESDLKAKEALQNKLIRFKADLEGLGIDTFLDLKEMQGDMRKCMQEKVSQSDIVFLIGTPQFKARADTDTLYRMPRLDMDMIPPGSAVLLVQDTVHFVQDGKLLNETIPNTFDVSNLRWQLKPQFIEKAQPSQQTTALIESARQGILEFPRVNNLMFELGMTLDKDPKALIPLLFEGEFEDAFPEVLRDFLIRDCRTTQKYYQVLVNTLRVVCPSLEKNKEYESLSQDLERTLQSIQNALKVAQLERKQGREKKESAVPTP